MPPQGGCGPQTGQPPRAGGASLATVEALPRAAPASWRGRLQALGEALGRQRHLLAVRDGVVGALPLVLAGSVFLLLAQPPSRALQAWVAPWVPLLLLPTRVLGGAISLYVAFACAYALAKSYQLDAASSGLVALASYLVAAVQPAPVGQLPTLVLQRLGAGGILAALAIGLGSVELTRFLVQRRFTVRLPPGTPEAVGRSLLALVPCLASVTVVFLVVHVAGAMTYTIVVLLAAMLAKGQARGTAGTGRALPSRVSSAS